jgi:hypothetical protein
LGVRLHRDRAFASRSMIDLRRHFLGLAIRAR